MEKKLGQDPAFPQDPFISPDGTVDVGSAYFGELSSGMSKRFYAACAAMQGILSGQDYRSPFANDEVVKVAYELADKLLEQENQ